MIRYIKDHFINTQKFSISKKNKIIRSDCVVVFFDIYGFSTLINTEKNKKPIIKKLLSIWRKLEKLYSHTKACKLYFFSDCGFILFPFSKGKDDDSIISDVFENIINLLDIYLDNDFFIRGAVACGEVFYNDNILVGDSVVRAVKYESEYCPGPFIMLPVKEMDNLFKSEDHFIRIYKEENLISKNGSQLMESILLFPANKKKYLDKIESNFKIYARYGPHNYARFWYNTRELLIKHIKTFLVDQ